MRGLTLLSASFAIIGLWSVTTLASPANTLVTKADDSGEDMSIAAIEEALAEALQPDEMFAAFMGRDDDDDDGDEGGSILNATTTFAAKKSTYPIDCADYPNVCENWCYYVFCHKKQTGKSSPAWTVTVDRKASKRGQSECGKYKANKCSTSPTASSGWPANPQKGWSCDEQPKNTNSEGGAGAATRCMPAGENSGEGAKWSNYINRGKDGYIKDGQKVMVVLNGSNKNGICASYTKSKSTKCPKPASPKDANVKTDAVRQQ